MLQKWFEKFLFDTFSTKNTGQQLKRWNMWFVPLNNTTLYDVTSYHTDYKHFIIHDDLKTASLLVVKWPRYRSTIRQKKTRTLPYVSSPMLTDNRKLHKHQYMYRKDLHISLNLIVFNYWMDYNKIQILQTNMKPSSCSAARLNE